MLKLRSKEFIDRWAKKVVPITIKNKYYCRLSLPIDNFNYSFLWNAYIIDTICYAGFMHDGMKLKITGVVGTLHTWAYYGFFKPTIAEVLSCTPIRILRQSRYFRLIGPEDYNELDKVNDVLNAGYHVGTAIFYKEENNVY